MLVAVALLVESLSADRADVGSFACMHSEVDMHITSRGHNLVAAQEFAPEARLNNLRRRVIGLEFFVHLLLCTVSVFAPTSRLAR